ncbi:methyltransferase-domain-containing protein [Chaetomium sp. MPI-CAGE-AT-0009]|nr:methyltransferase-domain-containing protein [Chaetomium sp. MPI-CAGE-AT-0009]
MFPVKGLSISAEKLKSETGVPAPSAPSTPKPKPAKKRKRPGQTGNVTAENLADLWEKVIEHKGPSASGANKTQPRNDNKRQKKEHETTTTSNPEDGKSTAQLGSKEQQKESGNKSEKKQKKKDKKDKRGSLTATAHPDEEEGDEWNGIDDEEGHSGAAQEVKEQTDKKTKKQKAGGDSKDNAKPSDKKAKSDTAAPPAPASTAPKLTPLQASMREKLISARFRHLNETLYTRPSAEAFQLFEDSPEMFTEYHEGFRRQVDVWPENPVDGYIADLKARAKVRFQPRNPNGPVTAAQLPLPKMHNTKTCTVADLGCGDAKLATALQPVARKLHLDIRSFDLQTGGSALVTRADIANLPLADNSVDVAIFCLALMGTNWLSFVEEAYRILRWRGELWVAEIKSRFTNPAAAHKSKVVAHSVGNRKKLSAAATKQAKAAAAEEEEAAQLAELAVQVDGNKQQQQQQQETDISAFVEALRKRGFLLSRDLGDGAVDMSNRMFVRMHFVKAAPALRGKCAAPGAEEKAASQGERKWTDGKGRTVQKKKFLDDDRDGDREGDGNEAAILKPCVYKIR